MFCEHCGTEIGDNASVCPFCGMEISRNMKRRDLAGNDKTAMALVCFFFGSIGVHNFIMGETKKGLFKILMLFCCGLSGIFALIDFIKILTDSYVVDPNSII